MYPSYRIICSVAKARGAHGEVVCVPVDGLPLLLRPGLTVHVVPPSLDGPRTGVVEHVANRDRGQAVTVSSIRSMEDAERVVGRYLLVREDELPDDLLVHDPAALVGLPVADVALGELGEIVSVMQGPANDVWEVEGPYGQVLVPVVEEFIRDVGPDGVLMALPDGLVGEERP